MPIDSARLAKANLNSRLAQSANLRRERVQQAQRPRVARRDLALSSETLSEGAWRRTCSHSRTSSQSTIASLPKSRARRSSHAKVPKCTSISGKAIQTSQA
eukprot:3761157-Pleurochrysis_carterae.AAC.3